MNLIEQTTADIRQGLVGLKPRSWRREISYWLVFAAVIALFILIR